MIAAEMLIRSPPESRIGMGFIFRLSLERSFTGSRPNLKENGYLRMNTTAAVANIDISVVTIVGES
jgi:hypothetical protein